MRRKSKETYYLDIALSVATRGTCLRRNYGAIIVNNDEIIATGYTGAPRDIPNCIDIHECLREKYNIPPRKRYELCMSVHAEQNAIISTERRSMIGSTMYIAGYEGTDFVNIAENNEPCDICKKLIINAGIAFVKFYCNGNVKVIAKDKLSTMLVSALRGECSNAKLMNLESYQIE